MNIRSVRKSAALLMAAAFSTTPFVYAQVTSTPPTGQKPDDTAKLEKYVVTGSMIKRIEGEGALPVQTISRLELEQQGVESAEQMISMLNINGNGLDNLASNADVVAGAQRGNNGATSANLRGQGSNATLILLNGRRIASHGLNGGVVDLNQIPFAAIQRVEILKDGASAIYGTDAIGGVINFILRDNFSGLIAQAGFDVTEQGGGNIYRGSILAGGGDLNRDKFNLMASISVTDSKMLRGDQRDWNNTFQPDRGLSVDTRGTPIANVFAISSLYSAISRDNLTSAGRGAGPLDPTNAAQRVNGISIVGLPGGPSYTGTGMQPYDWQLWSSAASKYGSAWDTGRAAVLQQPVRNTDIVTRGTYKAGQHRIIAEAILGRSESTKSFSPNQFSSSTATTTSLPNGTIVPNPLFNLAYPSTGTDYNRVFGILSGFFPDIAGNYGQPIAFRWRAMPIGNREIHTRTDTYRLLAAAEGPLGFLSQWEYRFGLSRASSDSFSVLSHGYVYSTGIANLIDTGVIDPFSLTQTPEAMAALDKVRADGVKLYGGTFTTDEGDLTTSGPLFSLPAGMIQAAVGVDWRVEKYKFNGDQRPNANSIDALIFNAPFDNTLATAGTLRRDIKAAFVELQIPIIKGMDLDPAARIDHYTGFGNTTNPKITFRYAPIDKFLVRASYSTGFRVPTFKQMFDPVIESDYVGNDFPDPATGATVVGPNAPAVHPVILSGGKAGLKPEKAKEYSAGFVVQPNPHLSFNVDWWEINRNGTIESLGLTVLAQNYALFKDLFYRDASGNLVGVDTRWVNAGDTLTKGIEFGTRGDVDALRGKISAGFDLSYLLDKKERLLENAPWSASEVNQFTRASDIGIRWKHTAFVSYRKGNWTGLFSQIYRGGYTDAVLPGVANGTVHPSNWNPKVKPWDIFNFSLTYRGFKNTTVIAGVKNLFNTDPPFSAIYDTNTGAGSDWDPRVADPRGRSYTLSVEYKFF